MKDLGVANFILGMEIKRDHANKKLWLNQRKQLRLTIPTASELYYILADFVSFSGFLN
jgi:hypothetical protein